MSTSDVFTLSQSPVNRFLFAEVGLEPSGLPLTVLSVLARLGEDPWRQAENWSMLPEKTVIDQLTQRIRQMPIVPQALVDARITARRLALLLPAQSARLPTGEPAPDRPRSRRDRVRITILIVGLGIGIAINVFFVSFNHVPLDAAAGQVGAVSQPLVSGR
jgi:hypothetical protein